MEVSSSDQSSLSKVCLNLHTFTVVPPQTSSGEFHVEHNEPMLEVGREVRREGGRWGGGEGGRVEVRRGVGREGGRREGGEEGEREVRRGQRESGKANQVK